MSQAHSSESELSDVIIETRHDSTFTVSEDTSSPSSYVKIVPHDSNNTSREHIFLCRSTEHESTVTHNATSLSPTYLVFETALLLLFSACFSCHSASTRIKKMVIGTFLRVTQLCRHCGKQYEWNSQPFIGTFPAGNVLTSSAILFTGSLPAKALQIFKVLKCATITRSTFFRHQKQFLQPAIRSVWRHQQDALFDVFKQQGKPLILAGDGRADSPGHSAKYGSYTVIELTCNKVVDFKLVQVSLCATVSIIIMHILLIFGRAMRWEEVSIWKKKACIVL